MMRALRLTGVLCALAACQVDNATGERFECTGDRQCAADFVCHGDICVEGPILDAGPAEPEPEPESDAEPEPPRPEAGPPMEMGPPDADRDGDGIPDAIDNCPGTANDQADRDGDGMGDSCDADLDGDGVDNVNDSCPQISNPDQRDRNANGRGDACEVECAAPGSQCKLLKVSCEAQGVCSAGFTIFEYRGTCSGGWCADFVEPALEVEGGLCGPQQVCQPGGEMPCAPVAQCPGEVECTPEIEGTVCRLPGEPGREARCVDGRCRAWNCMAPACNELGPRRFSTDESFGVRPGGNIDQNHLGLHWFLPGWDPNRSAPAVATLEDAHGSCTNAVYDGHDNWRLPTMYELFGLAATANTPRWELFEVFDLTRNLYFSRTMVDDGQVIGVSLMDGVASPTPRDSPAQVICVRAAEPPSVRDLTLRRAAFTAWRDLGDVRDPYTDLLWNEIPMQASHGDAADICETLDAQLPTVKALTTLMTFNDGPQRPAPGFWLEFDGAGFQPSAARAWAINPSPIMGEHLSVEFASGAVLGARDDALLDVLCVRWPVIPDDPE